MTKERGEPQPVERAVFEQRVADIPGGVEVRTNAAPETVSRVGVEARIFDLERRIEEAVGAWNVNAAEVNRLEVKSAALARLLGYLRAFAEAAVADEPKRGNLVEAINARQKALLALRSALVVVNASLADLDDAGSDAR